MTDYNAIPDSEIAVNAVIKGSTATKLRDGPIAITEGASGAPRIHTSALYAPALGDVVVARDKSVTDIDYNDAVESRIFPVLVAGSIRMTVTISNVGGSPAPEVEFFHNDTSIGTETGSGTHTADVSGVVLGDIVYMIVRGTGPGGSFDATGVAVTSSTENMAVG